MAGRTFRYIVLMCVASFLLSPLHAATVYLKEGGKIQGTIISETSESLSIDIGIGRVTVERQRVERIEDDEISGAGPKGTIPEPEAAVETATAPSGQAPDTMPPSSVPAAETPEAVRAEETGTGTAESSPTVYEQGSPAYAYLEYIKTVRSAQSVTDLKECLVEEEFEKMMQTLPDTGDEAQLLQMVKALVARDAAVLGQDIQGDTAVLTVSGITLMGPQRGTVHMEKQNGTWVVRSESWQSDERMKIRSRAPSYKETASISGTVNLPSAADMPRESVLYVLLQRYGDIQPCDYRAFHIAEITDSSVSYQFKGIAPGEYFVSAICDSAEPLVNVEAGSARAGQWGAPDASPASCIVGSDGDYEGNYGDTVMIEGGGAATGIDFECTRILRIVYSDDKEKYGSDYTLSDLRYEENDGEPALLVDVKSHEKEKDIAQITLLVFINGWMTNSFRSGTGFIGPEETYTYTIAEGRDDFTFGSYYAKARLRGQPLENLSIHLISSDNGAHCQAEITIPRTVVDSIATEQWEGGDAVSFYPEWGVPYQFIDITSENTAEGTVRYALHSANNSTEDIDEVHAFIIIESELSNISYTAPSLIPAGEITELDITGTVESCLENLQEKDMPGHTMVMVRVISKQNTEYFETLLER